MLRGCGLQSYGAAINFVSYILFGLPVGYFFEFTVGWGLPGLWVGMTLGYTFAGVCGIVVLLKMDWQTLSDDAQARANSKID